MQFPERFSSLPEHAFPRLRRLLDGRAPGGPERAMSIGEPGRCRDTPAGYPGAASIRAALLAGLDDAAAGLQAIRATLAAPRTAERV